MSGHKRQTLAILADSKKKGKAFVEELNEAFKASNTLSYKGDKKYPVLERDKKPKKDYGNK